MFSRERASVEARIARVRFRGRPRRRAEQQRNEEEAEAIHAGAEEGQGHTVNLTA